MTLPQTAPRADLAPPIISLAGMRSPDPADRAAIGNAFRAACTDKGFLYIVDHGIDPALQQAVFAEARRFFALSPERKSEVDQSRSPNKRGFEPLRGQILEPGAPPDLKEGFYFGNELPPDHPDVRAGLFNHEPNQWPDTLPGFRETLQSYYAQMETLCALTMRALALALDLPEPHFDAFCDNAISNMKLLHYPPQPATPMPDEKGCGAHTDWGALTYLLQDDTGGLQVWDETHGWIDAPPIPGAYVVNLGDLIARWTNNRFRSTLHRVINASGRERYSIPFFFTGRADYKIETLPTCLAQGEISKYPNTTPLAHLQQMYEQSYNLA